MSEDTHYLALYRKYRPLTFEDVKGRDAIVKTLKNQILSGRIGHSYLFCGTRGTGKTSIAKIFARAVNCENPQDGSPCGACASCLAIARDASLNVVEMDAASNNGVDAIRNIIDEVSYSPTQGKYRVYIIDEVHMLSTGAFNALLKTLEEPPSYAVFILATTEPNKLPITILSRCQRYDFGRLSTQTIADRLTEVCEAEKIQAEDKALRYIAGAADGSMRDGLSLLDQCNAFNYGNDILTYDKTLEILGAVDTRVFSKLFRAVEARDVAGTLQILDEILMQGRELMQFVTDYIWYLRNMMLLKASNQIQDALDLSADSLAQIKEDGELTEMDAIMRYIRVFSGLVEQIRFSANRRILTEMAIIRLCEPAMDDDGQAMQERIRTLEKQLLSDEKILADLKKGGVSLAPGFATTSSEGGDENKVKKPAPKLPMAIPEDIKTVASKWASLLGDMRGGIEKASLMRADLSLAEDGSLLVVFDNYISGDLFIGKEENREWLKQYLAAKTGKDIRITYKSLDKGEKFADNYVDLRDRIRMNIEVDE